MRLTSLATLTLIALVTDASGQELRLRPAHADAVHTIWAPGAGLPDAFGNGAHALHLTGPCEQGAPVLVVDGLTGTAVEQLRALSWKRLRPDKGIDLPFEWRLEVLGLSGERYTIFLNSQNTSEMPPPGGSSWVSEELGVQGGVLQQGGFDALAGHIELLALVASTGDCEAFLDNLVVTVGTVPLDWIFSGPDNSSQNRRLATFHRVSFNNNDCQLFVTFDLLTLDVLWLDGLCVSPNAYMSVLLAGASEVLELTFDHATTRVHFPRGYVRFTSSPPKANLTRPMTVTMQYR